MFTQDLPIRLAVYKFKLEWFRTSSRKRFPVEYRYDLGESVRNNIIDLSKCVILGTEFKDLHEKYKYYDAACAILASVMDDFNLMNDLNIIDNDHKAKWDIMLVDIKGQLHSLRDSLLNKIKKGQSTLDSSNVEKTL